MRTSFQHYVFTPALLRRLSFALVCIMVALTAASASATGVESTRTRVAPLPPTTAPTPESTAKQGLTTNAAKWNYGNSVYTQTWNCTILGGGYQETLAISSVAYYGELGVTPRVGDVYYVMAQWAVSGYPCGNGGAVVYLEFFLPEGTQIAISEQNRVRCFHDYFLTNQPSVEAQDCPQQPGNGQKGGLSFNPSHGYYNTATGTGWRIMVPVVSTKALNGVYANPCKVCVQAAIWQIDGNYSPWAYPYAPVYVANNAPTIGYPSPSATNITNNSAHTRSYLYSHYTSGNAFVDLGTTTAYGTVDGPISIPANSDAFVIDQDWNQLTPGTTYHWRLRFVTAGGQTILGADQTFTTTGTSQPSTYTLTMSTTNGGSTSASPQTQNGVYTAGTVVNLTATPNTGYRFTGWTVNGANGGTANPLAVTMNKNHTVVANFVQNTATNATVTIAPPANGTVAMSPAGGTYPLGTSLTLTATARAGYRFGGWTIDGAAHGDTNPYTLTVTGNHTIAATFIPETGTLPYRTFVPFVLR